MNIFCDQCVNHDVVVALRAAGLNVVHASDVGLSRAGDMDIFRYAQHSRRILFTFDHGFGNLTRFAIHDSYGVVLMYIAGMDRKTIVDRTLFVFKHLLKNRHISGRLFIIKTESIRIWPKR